VFEFQGDGINIATLGRIMDAVLDAGFSAEVRWNIKFSKRFCTYPVLASSAGDGRNELTGGLLRNSIGKPLPT